MKYRFLHSFIHKSNLQKLLFILKMAIRFNISFYIINFFLATINKNYKSLIIQTCKYEEVLFNTHKLQSIKNQSKIQNNKTKTIFIQTI